MSKSLEAKLGALKKYLMGLNKVFIAFSGGVDSTFLLKVSADTLGLKNVTACIAKSMTFPKSELKCALRFVKKNKIPYVLLSTKEFENKKFLANPVDRCYFCKKELFMAMNAINKKFKGSVILDGTNYDDRLDTRHGTRAKNENNVLSPLAICRFSKDDIRVLSKKMGLATHDKPAMACLASRIPHGSPITGKALGQVEKCENFLRKFIKGQLRVRHFGSTAKIEIEASEFKTILSPDILKKIIPYFRSIGFKHLALDIEGYRMGNLGQEASHVKKTF